MTLSVIVRTLSVYLLLSLHGIAIARAEELHVPSEYPTIQAAADAAQDGDSIIIAPGSYVESVLLPNVSLRIVGSGSDQTFICGDTDNDGVAEIGGFFLYNNSSQFSPDISIQGITFSICTAGFFANHASSLQIDGCVFESIRQVAVGCNDLLSDTTINQSVFNECDYGIRIDSDSSLGQSIVVCDSTFTECETGMRIRQPESGPNVVLDTVSIVECNESAIVQCGKLFVLNCEFRDSASDGINFTGDEFFVLSSSFSDLFGSGVESASNIVNVDDCVFERNLAVTTSNFSGAGMKCGSPGRQVSAVIRNSNFIDNQSWSSGSLVILGGEGSSCEVTGCTFRGNKSGVEPYPNYGSGWALLANIPEVTIEGCEFSENIGSSPGAVRIISAQAVIEGCLFKGNAGQPARAGESNRSRGGAISLYQSNLSIQSCRFEHNSAARAGAIEIPEGSSAWIRGCEFLGNSAVGEASNDGGGALVGNDNMYVANSTFIGNTSSSLAGAILPDEVGFPVVANCTFYDNVAPLGSVAANRSSLPIRMHNSIIVADNVENIVHDFPGANDSLYYSNIIATISRALDFESIPDDGSDGWGDDLSTPSINESLNDDFGSLRLQAHSPAIDAGDGEVISPDLYDLDDDLDLVEPVTGGVDLAGNARFVDNTGVPNAYPPGDFRGPIDIGAYEFQGTTCLPDSNNDGMVSPTDFNAWINAFNNNLPECDQNQDGACTPTDFNAWIANFNAGC